MRWSFQREALRAIFALAVAIQLGGAGCDGECDDGTSRCQGNDVWYCGGENTEDGWDSTPRWHMSTCQNYASICIETHGHAICVSSTEPDPMCGTEPNYFYCMGSSQPVQCSFGYVVGLGQMCGLNDPALTECVRVNSINSTETTCVPRGSMPDETCRSNNYGGYCDGTTLVGCWDGLAVARTACASCTEPGLAPCIGFLGDTCTADSACATGLTCHPDTKGISRCTAACEPAAAGAAQACLDLFLDGGPPVSGLHPVWPHLTMACAAGFCEWM